MLVVVAEAAAAEAAAARLSLLVAVAVVAPLCWQVVAAVAAQMMWMAAVVVAAALWRWMRPGQLVRREGQRLAGRQLHKSKESQEVKGFKPQVRGERTHKHRGRFDGWRMLRCGTRKARGTVGVEWRSQ